MGAQNSSAKQSSVKSQISVPQSGYRVINLHESINNDEHKLSIMTDYVIGQDPRLINLKQLFQKNQQFVEFDVFNILQYKIRKVRLRIRRNKIHENENQFILQQIDKATDKADSFNKSNKIIENLSQNQLSSSAIFRQFTIGVNFKYYSKINDTILRITKIFKNSPLQQEGNIKKDQYVVGVMEGDFTEMKQFVDVIKTLIQLKFEFVTLAICNLEGKTRLEKIPVSSLEKWKKQYGVGYLGVQLAEGWANKWELKKIIQANKIKSVSSILTKTQQLQTPPKQNSSKEENKIQAQQSTMKGQRPLTSFNIKQQQSVVTQQSTIQRKQQSTIMTKMIRQQKSLEEEDKQAKEQVDMFKRFPSQVISEQQQSFKLTKSRQLSIHQDQRQTKTQQLSKIQSNTDKNNIEEGQSSNSEISSDQIEQRCTDLQQNLTGKKKQLNLVKKSNHILQINFKDDASTICMCKEYSKHCEKCFKQKQGNYYFFNKKTNKIILIQKSMLFPKKN